jgi:hypothetical protein
MCRKAGIFRHLTRARDRFPESPTIDKSDFVGFKPRGRPTGRIMSNAHLVRDCSMHAATFRGDGVGDNLLNAH